MSLPPLKERCLNQFGTAVSVRCSKSSTESVEILSYLTLARHTVCRLSQIWHFFKNLPSNSLPTGKSFQSIATKFPYPGLHIAVHPKAGPEKGTIKISPNKSLQSLFINAAASPKTLTSSRQVGSQIHPHVGRRKIQISPPRGEQDWSNALPQGQQKQSNPTPCPAPPPPPAPGHCFVCCGIKRCIWE